MTYQPQIGDMATVNLPGEVTRAEIRKVVSDKAMIAELLTFTTAKDHAYKKGDLVPFRLKKSGLGQIIWEAIPEREIRESVARTDAERGAALLAEDGAVPIPDCDSVAVLGSN